MTVKVLIADDHTAIRAGLGLMLDADPGIEVVGEAADGEVALRQARSLRPDIVLMDIRMPRLDGIAATRAIVAEGLADVLVLTTFDLDEYVFGALRAGAAGFLLKSTGAAELVAAVRRVAAGEGVLAPEVTRTMLDAFVRADAGRERGAAATTSETGRRSDGAGSADTDGAGSADRTDGSGLDGLAALTQRETEVLGCLGRGLSNHDIAVALYITEATTKTHVSHVLAKLGCRSRMQAAIIARESGLA